MVFSRLDLDLVVFSDRHHPSTHDYLNPEPVRVNKTCVSRKTKPHRKRVWYSLPPAINLKDLLLIKQSCKQKREKRKKYPEKLNHYCPPILSLLQRVPAMLTLNINGSLKYDLEFSREIIPK